MPPRTPASHQDPPDPADARRYRSAFEHAPWPTWICDLDQRCTEVNAALCEMLGLRPEELIGRRFSEFSHPSERESARLQAEAMLAGARDSCAREQRLIRPDGAAIWVRIAIKLVRDTDGRALYFVAQANDLSDYHLRERRLRHLADHDPLTGLLNRRGFRRELRRHVSRLARYGTKGALLMLDLDDFKGYNDAHGHAGGDDLLRTVGSSLAGRLRAGDVIGRIGGDEFAVLLPEATPEGAEVVAAALVQAVRELAQDSQPKVTASAGIISFNDVDPLTEDAAMAGADVALYAAKQAGRDRHSASPE